MKKGCFIYCNVKYEDYIIISSIQELIEYRETIKENPNLVFVYDRWVEIINDDLILVINPLNGISYFCIPKTIEII